MQWLMSWEGGEYVGVTGVCTNAQYEKQEQNARRPQLAEHQSKFHWRGQHKWTQSGINKLWHLCAERGGEILSVCVWGHNVEPPAKWGSCTRLCKHTKHIHIYVCGITWPLNSLAYSTTERAADKETNW